MQERPIRPTALIYRRRICCFFNSTVFHCEIDKMFALVEKFIHLKTDEKKLFYIWGHSHEFDRAECAITWEVMEEFCKLISNKEDIFYGTNEEVLL